MHQSRTTSPQGRPALWSATCTHRRARSRAHARARRTPDRGGCSVSLGLRGHNVPQPAGGRGGSRSSGGLVVGKPPAGAGDARLERRRVGAVLEQLAVVIAFEHQRMTACSALLDVRRGGTEVGQVAQTHVAVGEDELRFGSRASCGTGKTVQGANRRSKRLRAGDRRMPGKLAVALPALLYRVTAAQVPGRHPPPCGSGAQTPSRRRHDRRARASPTIALIFGRALLARESRATVSFHRETTVEHDAGAAGSDQRSIATRWLGRCQESRTATRRRQPGVGWQAAAGVTRPGDFSCSCSRLRMRSSILDSVRRAFPAPPRRCCCRPP